MLSVGCAVLPPCICLGQSLHQEQLTPSSSCASLRAHTVLPESPLPVLMERPYVIRYLLQGHTPSSWQGLLIIAERFHRQHDWPASEKPLVSPYGLTLSDLRGRGLPCVL